MSERRGSVTGTSLMDRMLPASANPRPRRKTGGGGANRLKFRIRINRIPVSPTVPLTYRDAGVDIDAGDALVERIKPFAKRTLRPEVLGGIGGFGALVEVSKKYREPVMG